MRQIVLLFLGNSQCEETRFLTGLPSQELPEPVAWGSPQPCTTPTTLVLKRDGDLLNSDQHQVGDFHQISTFNAG
jgi:hypothetical protein